METFFISTDENGEPIINYYDSSFISDKDSYLLENKMYGEFIRKYDIKEENFEPPDICAVCMLSKNEMVRQLYLKTPCNHTFCSECVSKLLLSNSVSCPLCRSNINFFPDFHYSGDLIDPIPETDFYSLESESDTDTVISQQEYDQTLYELLVEYWATIL